MTGGCGIMAHALYSYFPNAHYLGRDEMDVNNPNMVRMTFQKTQPELVIHCAAVTAHDSAPMNYVMTNIQGTINVMAQARKCGARVVYLSTDYLNAPKEEDPVQPIGLYAASKYAGELCVRPFANTLTIRGSWYSHLDYEYAATDAFTSRMPVDKAAYYIAMLAVSKATGVFNVAGQRRSQFECALESNEQVVPCLRSQIHAPYAIPADSSLNTQKLTNWLKTAA